MICSQSLGYSGLLHYVVWKTGTKVSEEPATYLLCYIRVYKLDTENCDSSYIKPCAGFLRIRDHGSSYNTTDTSIRDR
jgi:hypothetical protein